jgi:hypothetical protein
MATLTVRTINYGTYTVAAVDTYSGLLMTALDAPAAAGDKFLNDGRTFFMAANADADPYVITFKRYRANSDGVIQDLVMPIAAGATRMIGPFSEDFNDGNGMVNVTYDAVTTMTVAAVRLAEKGS